MPINPKMKAIIESDTSMTPEYKAKLLETFEDAPAEFQNGWMSQQDYMRSMGTFRQEQKDWKEKADKFYTDSNSNIDAWKKEVNEKAVALTQAQSRITDLEQRVAAGTLTAGNENAALAEIQKLQAAVDRISQDVEKKFSEKLTGVVTKQDLDNAYANAVGFLGQNQLVLRDIERRYERTFSTPDKPVLWDAKKAEELIEFANGLSQKEKRQVDLEYAYEKKYQDEIKKHERAIIAAEAIADYKSKHETPGGGGVGPGGASSAPEVGPLQIRLAQERDKAAGKSEGYYQTWQEAAAAASNELVNEGKF